MNRLFRDTTALEAAVIKHNPSVILELFKWKVPYEADVDKYGNNIFHLMCQDSYQCSHSLLEDTIYLFLTDYSVRNAGRDRMYMVKNVDGLTALDVLITSNLTSIDRCVPILLLLLSDYDRFTSSTDNPWHRMMRALDMIKNARSNTSAVITARSANILNSKFPNPIDRKYSFIRVQKAESNYGYEGGIVIPVIDLILYFILNIRRNDAGVMEIFLTIEPGTELPHSHTYMHLNFSIAY